MAPAGLSDLVVPLLTRIFHTSRRFHPGYSLLGRWLRRSVGDRRRAEALHILIGTGFALALVLAHFVASTFWPPAAQPMLYTAVLGGALALALGLGVVGFQPTLAVVCRDKAGELHLQQGADRLTVPYDAIESVEPISALRFHRHERRYAATHVFIGSLGDEVLLLRTGRGPVVIGLDAAADQSALAEHLETARAAARTEDALA